jgi:DNA-directed RNA polymerase specialized sigma24 family protein
VPLLIILKPLLTVFGSTSTILLQMAEIIDYNTEPSENLLEYIQWKDEAGYEEIAKEAFRSFTFRFQLDLQKKLIPICRNWGYDDHIANEIAVNTFTRIWKYPRFDPSKGKQQDVNRSVIFYLYGIAKRLLADYKKNLSNEGNPFDGDEQIIRELPDIEIMNLGRLHKEELKRKFELLNNALNRLSPKHKIIYLTYKQYENETQNGFKMPRKLLKNLRTELDLTQSTIRVYRSRRIFKTLWHKIKKILHLKI